MEPGNRRAVLAAMAANSGIAVAKVIGWAFTGSASMLAEATHSVADTANQGLLLWGGASARRAPTPEHAFGYGRERYFWAFVVSLVLFSVGGLFAIREGVLKLLHPHPLERPEWAIGILLLGIALEGASLRLAVVEARRSKGSADWWTFVRRTKTPELPVVLLEDLGALIGLTLALVGIGAAMATGDARFDGLASIAIGVLLVAISGVLAFEMKSLLIGESARPEHRELILEALLAGAEIRRVIHLRTQHLGPEELLVAAKVEFDASLTFRQLAAAINAAEARLRARLPIARVVYLEPDVWRASPPESQRPRDPETGR